MMTLSSPQRNTSSIKKRKLLDFTGSSASCDIGISFLSLCFASPFLSLTCNVICLFMVSMHSFLSAALKSVSNSISASIHQCAWRKCSLTNFMEISFCLHSLQRKLDVHMLKSQLPWLDKCQAYLSMYHWAVCRFKFYKDTYSHNDGLQGKLQKKLHSGTRGNLHLQQNWASCFICYSDVTQRSKVRGLKRQGLNFGKSGEWVDIYKRKVKHC